MRIGRTSVLLFLIFIISVSAVAQDQLLGKGINAQRIYNTDEGPETVIVATEPSASNRKLHLFLCKSVSEFNYVKKLTSKAQSKTIDLYWNASAERYVISWLEKSATLYIALFDPESGKVQKTKVNLSSADIGTSKQLRSLHTTYNPDRNVYTACVSDGPTQAFLDLDADSFEIVNSRITSWSRNGETINIIIGDIVYSDAFDKYYGILEDVTNRDLYTVFFNNVEDSSYKTRGGKFYVSNIAPPVELCIFPSTAKRDEIYFAYLEENPVTGSYDIKSNRISKSGRPGKLYWDYEGYSDAYLGFGGVDHVNKKVHYVSFEADELFPDYKFRPAFRLYSVNFSGRHTNGPEGALLRVAPAGVERTGSAVVDENIVVFYTKGKKTYYFPLSYGGGGSVLLSVPAVEIKGVNSFKTRLDGLNTNGFEISFDVTNVDINKILSSQLVTLSNAEGSMEFGGLENGSRFIIGAYGKAFVETMHINKAFIYMAIDRNRDGVMANSEYYGMHAGQFNWKKTNSIRVRSVVKGGITTVTTWVNGEQQNVFSASGSYWNPAPVLSVGGFITHEWYVPPVGATISNLTLTNLK